MTREPDYPSVDSLGILNPPPSPLAEYQAAFDDREAPFIHYYTFDAGVPARRSFRRGEFHDLARAAAAAIARGGITKGQRVVHFFAANSPYDLVFRLAALFTGAVPVTVNWQTDDDERLLYKLELTGARALVYPASLAERVAALKPQLKGITLLRAEDIENTAAASPLPDATLDWEDERTIIFTSGTTALPKGVSLPQRSFLAGRRVFEDYLGIAPGDGLDLLLVNPLHHVNSTVFADWGLRRRGAVVHLLERYTTPYWQILDEAAMAKRDWLIAPLVSRHFDFLESLAEEGKLPLPEDRLRESLAKVEFLIGSAPVGPKTVKNIYRFSGRYPHVRFGATETCLEVMATPTGLSPAAKLAAFEAGWAHKQPGYYIGRPHVPFTEVRLVLEIDPAAADYLKPCAAGEPGYLITRGANIMSGYVANPEATAAVFADGWYTGLKDIGFALESKEDGGWDYYWLSRDSELLIRGGANYAYAQVAAVLSRFVTERYHLDPARFRLAVVGLRLVSEHEDSCCVTLELGEGESEAASQIAAIFLQEAAQAVTKAYRPDYLRLAAIPLNFKGAVLYPKLKNDYRAAVERGEAITPV